MTSPSSPVLGNDAPLEPEPAAEAELEQRTQSEKIRLKPIHWLIMSFLACCCLTSTAALSWLWLTSLPQETNCQKLTALSSDRELLSCAQAAAQSGQLADVTKSLNLVAQWTPDHPLYTEAQHWMAQWSDSLLIKAKELIRHRDLQSSIALVNRIPKSSPAYEEAQATIATWQQQWQIGEQIKRKAQLAMQHQQWNRAAEQILRLREFDYDFWRIQQADRLTQQIVWEKQARQWLSQAEQQARSGQLQDLARAIRTTDQISRQTYTWKVAQTYTQRWGDTLLKAGFQAWRRGNLQQAIDLAEQTALIPAWKREAQNLIYLSRAHQVARVSSVQWQVTPKHLGSLITAIALAQQISPDSRFRVQARGSFTAWQTQLADLAQLQAAQMLADLRQPASLKLAIAQAQQIAPDRPRRRQAQTLVAHWYQEIQRIEDAPYLAQARELADPDSIPALKAAIREANMIAKGRALWGEAQGLISQWQRQIQVLEDEPFLNLARLQARQGELSLAIDTASVIRPGRALYAEAQAAIQAWQVTIQNIAAQTEAEAAALAAPEPVNRTASTSSSETATSFLPQPDPAPRPTNQPSRSNDPNSVGWSGEPNPLSRTYPTAPQPAAPAPNLLQQPGNEIYFSRERPEPSPEVMPPALP